MIKVAITGNIASGKSQAEKILEESGYTVYDSDKIAHEVLDSIKSFYGYDIFIDGKIDRKKLGNLVFTNSVIRQKLEKLTHPIIKNKIINLFELHRDESIVFVSVPLLYEAGFDDMFDKVLLITTDPNAQLKRLMKRNNLTKDEALARINSQLPQDIKEQKADYVIENNGSLNELKNNIKEFIGKISAI